MDAKPRHEGARSARTNGWNHALPLAALVIPPQITEVRVDSLPPMLDIEYVEISGPGGDALDGLAIVVLGDAGDEPVLEFGNSGVVESVVHLDGHIVPDDHALLVHSSGMLLALPDVTAALNLEDADNLTVLLVRGAKCAEGDDLDLDDDGTLDIMPWSEVVDGVSIASGAPGIDSEWTYAPAQLGPNPLLFVCHAYRCLDTGEWKQGGADFRPGVQDTPGSTNQPCQGWLCTADIDADGNVGASDLSILLADWGAFASAAPERRLHRGSRGPFDPARRVGRVRALIRAAPRA
ncbi:MAG: hypothetical protein ACKOYN_03975 [Planctomycetota bacterium]